MDQPVVALNNMVRVAQNLQMPSPMPTNVIDRWISTFLQPLTDQLIDLNS